MTGLENVRRTIYDLLERGSYHHRASLLVTRSIALLIVINLSAMVLESIPELQSEYRRTFLIIEYVSLVVFTVEYLLILWCAVEHPPLRHLAPWKARLMMAISPSGIVDLLAVLPFWISLFEPFDLRALIVFRILRFLKLSRYSPAMRSLLEALYAERRALIGCLVIFFGAVLIAATFMHVAEGQIQPQKFGTIPESMWWAVVTLATIGYGDAVPVTGIGKIIGSVTIITGLVMIALPVGIVASAFSEQVHRRDFIVTWGMVARVPLFAGFDAKEIADVMQMLRAQSVEQGTVITRRGDPAHSMYFIAAGAVEIDLAEKAVKLRAGHFFGEAAVVRRAQRSANVTALTRCDLLVLEADDLHVLMSRDKRIAERIAEAMRRREGDEDGDLLVEEFISSAELDRRKEVVPGATA